MKVKFPLRAIVSAALLGATFAAEDPLVFEKSVRPILETHCVECHNPDTRKANLDLSTASGLLAGGDAGTLFEAGEPKKSLFYERVHTGEMPHKRDPLSHAQIDLIAKWIEGGARFETPLAVAERPLNQHDVIPIMLLRCAACHGPQLTRGDLDFRSKAAALEGGVSGPAIVPGDPDGSLAIQRIESEACPPSGQLLKYFVKRPTAEETQKLRKWIAAGAPEEPVEPDVATTEPDPLVDDDDRRHWSFQPLGNPAAPKGDFANPVDAFLHHKLSEQGLTFSPEATRNTLIRRAYFDLTGLPPTLVELDLWERHPSANWYPELIEQLLASPRYGERWGRHWLDVAGYSDSEGGQSADTVREVAWKYRDYVIRAFNDDKPFDRFLLEQIAGDELADYTKPEAVTDEIVDNLVATGFLRMSIDQTGSRTMNFVPERLGLIADALNVVSSGVMGLSMECARCHGHKYDPIPQRDYYRMKAVFQGAFDEHDWLSWQTRKIDIATPDMLAEFQATNPALEKEIKAFESQQKKAIGELQNRYFTERWPTISKELQSEIEDARKATVGRMTLRQEELVERYNSFFKPALPHLVEMHPELQKTLDELDGKIAELRQQLLPPLTIRALWDRGAPSPTYILGRGEHNQPGRLVGPGAPSVLTDGKTPFEVVPPWAGAEKTGRRLAFARWLVEPDNPLTARVFVNRVWKHHFGQGIVRTLDNFGAKGEAPSHPELLDWLARDFVNRGWSVKELHRRIMLSKAYTQVSDRTSAGDEIDPENRLLSRMTMRRQDAEALRDSILFVSGRLDEKMFGPPSEITAREDGLITEVEVDGVLRRSVYLQYRRTQTPSLMATFDYPEMQPNCVERGSSTVSPQALMLINNAKIYELARGIASRAHKGGENEIETLYRIILSRSPDDEELAAGQSTLWKLKEEWSWTESNPDLAEENALGTFCHILINSAEFIYVD